MVKKTLAQGNKTAYTHDGENRTNNPDARNMPTTDKFKKHSYSFSQTAPPDPWGGGGSANIPINDPHDDPKLEWYLKQKTDEFEIDIVSLHTHEKINPPDIISPILNDSQTTLFFNNDRPYREAHEFYKHEDAWANRLILGDSLLVMTSLLEKEPKIAGQVQMIYYDPPYGINWSGNFQSGFKPSGGDNIEYRPEAIKAFRDTWEHEIHSYLSMLRKQLLVAQAMLADTGSIFVQISQVNVHRVRLILDEIFGSDNFMWDIMYQTKTGAGSPRPSTCDYILWYAKDTDLLKKSDNLHQLYLDRDEEKMKIYNQIHLTNGSVVSIPKDGKIPKGSKLCTTQPTDSQKNIENDKTKPHTFPNGITIKPNPNRQWMLGSTGLDKLFEKKRLYFSKNRVRFITYPDDFPSKLDNIWKGMSIVGEKIYDVQTRTTVIERCMLMCTNPGDLIMDLTCGSGVTPYVAEQHGRRWITTDVSKLSIAITTARLQLAVYDWYKLKNDKIGICGGLKYEEFYKLTQSEIIKPPEEREIQYRYDKPIVEKKRLRITGPFTVESVPSPVIISSRDQIDDSTRKTWADGIRTAGIDLKNGEKLKFTRLEPMPNKNSAIHYIGITDDDVKYAISFGPKNSPLGLSQVERAIQEKRSHEVDGLIFIASIFGPEAKDVIYNTLEDSQVFGAEANADMLIPDLKNKESDNAFVQIGRPRIDIKNNSNGKYTVELLGYDYFDVESGKLTSEGTDKIALWMLDTNYDDHTLIPMQMFFPNTDHVKDFGKKLKKVLKEGEINFDKLEQFKGTTSIPFELGERMTIAVKIVDMHGREAKYSRGVGKW